MAELRRVMPKVIMKPIIKYPFHVWNAKTQVFSVSRQSRLIFFRAISKAEIIGRNRHPNAEKSKACGDTSIDYRKPDIRKTAEYHSYPVHISPASAMSQNFVTAGLRLFNVS